MGDRKKARGRRPAPPAPAGAGEAGAAGGVVAHGWTVLAHPRFIAQIEALKAGVARERRSDASAPPGPNAKLLQHLLNLAFDAIPRDPGGPAFRHGGTLGPAHRHWFRAKTGNGRFRLFYRFHSRARVIVLAWVNDAESLRTRGSATDAYAVFRRMLDTGDPPESWDALVAAARDPAALARAQALSADLPSPP